MPSYIRHHRIRELGGLFYMQGQPYPYLDSILLYHRRKPLNGTRLLRQVHISAREVRAFAHRVAGTNGNFHLFENKNTVAAAAAAATAGTASGGSREVELLGAGLSLADGRPNGLTINVNHSRRHSQASSDVSLITSSSGSTNRRK
ncbi:C-type lectin isoform 1 [Plakobranchus ocellatus]|uniref:C-type lectin isoform 1 n=1 Tax=Plakobranchus ocellatus TaxID=259542 RepID=A0AAV3YWX7_9GAST|nr:C-type lectin isoform 1 [Plakobranchus ocellatus]